MLGLNWRWRWTWDKQTCRLPNLACPYQSHSFNDSHTFFFSTAVFAIRQDCVLGRELRLNTKWINRPKQQLNIAAYVSYHVTYVTSPVHNINGSFFGQRGRRTTLKSVAPAFYSTQHSSRLNWCRYRIGYQIENWSIIQLSIGQLRRNKELQLWPSRIEL